MSNSSLTKKFEQHGVRAAELFNQGRKRESANEYWTSFQYSPSLTNRIRWQIFHGYTSILKECYFQPTEDDLDNLRKVLKDKQELRLYRLEAGFALGLMHYDRGERFEAGDTYYEAITIGEKKVSKHDKKMEQKQVQFNTDFLTIKALTDTAMTQLRENLEAMTTTGTNSIPAPVKRSDGTIHPNPGYMFRADCNVLESITSEEMNLLVQYGGDKCDCCGKKEGDANGGTLFKCTRCNKAFYCSKECQRKSWKVYGHKNHCRKDGEIKAGDIVRLNGLKSKPELNDAVVKVVGPAPQQEGRWEVKVNSANKNMSIAGKNIKQLRPFDCLRRKQ